MPDHEPSPIEVGCLVYGPLTPTQRSLAEQAFAALLERLQEAAPEFDWKWAWYDERPADGEEAVGIIDLFEKGLQRVTSEALDVLFIVTGQSMVGVEGERLRAAGSSSAGLGAVSLDAVSGATPGQLQAQLFRLFGHMIGVAGHDGGTDSAHRDNEPGRGNRATPVIDGGRRATLVEALRRVADLRVEERGVSSGLAFYSASVAENWRQLLHGLVRARPWSMPLRLSRLTTAAASALFVLMMTAEVWELGMAQSGAAVCALSVLVLGFTALYVLMRQRLLRAVRPGRLTEQVAVMQTAVILGMFSGLLSTYALLFLVSFGAATTLYPDPLVGRWGMLGPEGAKWGDYMVFAGFVSAIGVVIGALGASFERQSHLKALTLLDYEIQSSS